MSKTGKKPENPLTDQQVRFCHEFVKPKAKIVDSLLAAGYSPKYALCGGNGLLGNPRIKAKIEELRKPIEKQFQISRAKQIERLEAVVEDCDAKNSDRLKAIEIINKMMGLNEPEKHEVAHCVLRDDLETTLKKAERLLVENGYEVRKKKSA